MSSNSSKGYQFTVQDGVITAVYKTEKGRTKLERMDSDETWTVDAGRVVKTEWDDGRWETSVYADDNGDGVFHKVSEFYGTPAAGSLPPVQTFPYQGYQKEGYAFDIVSGAVTAVYEVERGVYRQERSDYNESWSLQGADVVKTKFEKGFAQVTLYSDGDGDGVFHKVSKSYASLSDFQSGGDGNDLVVAGRGQDQLSGGLGNDVFKWFSVADAGVTRAGRDAVVDFAAGDRIDLSAIDAVAGNRTNDAFTFIGTSAALTGANANGALWFEAGVLYGSTDRDMAAEFQIELVGVEQLAVTDLVL